MGSGGAAIEDALRYAMSLPVATTTSGIDSIEVLYQNLQIAKGFKPLSAPEMSAIRTKAKEFVADGRFELYKTTTKYDGDIGREQHHYPTTEELPA